MNRRMNHPTFDQLEARLLLSTTPQLAALFAEAENVPVLPAASIDIAGSLQGSGDSHMYRFATPARGRMALAMVGSGIDPYLELFNSRQQRVAVNNNASRVTLDSLISRTVSAGETYYLLARSSDGAAGDFTLRMTSIPVDDRANSAAAALALRLSGTGSGAVNGIVNYATDVDFCKFVAADTGLARLAIRATGAGSALAASVAVMDAQQNVLATFSGGVAAGNAAFSVVQGQTYYVVATGAAGTTGAYQMAFSSIVPQEFIDAVTITPGAADILDLAGDIVLNEAVAYRYTATANGLTYVQASSAGGSLNTYVDVLDSNLRRIVCNNNAAAGTTDSALRFATRTGQTYYIRVSGASGTAGEFNARVITRATDDVGDTMAAAATIRARANSSVAATKIINYVDDVDVFKVVAPVTGKLKFEFAGLRPGTVDAKVIAYDADGVALAEHTCPFTAGAYVEISAVIGTTYYFAAMDSGVGGGTRTGYYGLRVTATAQPPAPAPDPAPAPADDVGNTIAAAAVVQVQANSSSVALRAIDYAGDVDFFRVVAPATGTLKFELAGVLPNTVDAKVVAYNASGVKISEHVCPFTAGAYVEISVVSGATYYFAAMDSGTGGGTGIGAYGLVVTSATPPPPVVPPAPADPAPGAAVAGVVVTTDGVQQLRVTGTTGNDTITLSWTGSAVRVVSAAGTQDYAGTFGSVAVCGFDGADTIRTAWSLTMDTFINGGAGNDTIYENAQGDGSVYGGAGDDLIIAVGGGIDVVRGEDGADSFWADSTDTLSDVSSAETASKAVHRIASFYQPYAGQTVSREINGQNFTDPTANGYGPASYNFAANPVFSDGPTYDDIRQGSVGDCYYLASLAGLADSDPGLVRQMITSLGDGTYAIRFYRGGQEVYLRLDADLPTYSGSSLAYAKLTPDGEIWVALMEKGYAHFRYGQNTYDSISGGWMSTVNGELTNVSSITRSTSGAVTDLTSFLQGELNAGHAITAGSYSSPASPIVGGHAYQVKSLDTVDGQTYVTVYNPWGSDGRSYDSNYNDGLLRITAGAFQQCFSAVVAAQA